MFTETRIHRHFVPIKTPWILAAAKEKRAGSKRGRELSCSLLGKRQCRSLCVKLPPQLRDWNDEWPCLLIPFVRGRNDEWAHPLIPFVMFMGLLGTPAAAACPGTDAVLNAIGKLCSHVVAAAPRSLLVS